MGEEKFDFSGVKYGTFQWVRGTIDIHDLDDIKYVQVCLNKIRKRIRNKKNTMRELEKNAK